MTISDDGSNATSSSSAVVTEVAVPVQSNDSSPSPAVQSTITGALVASFWEVLEILGYIDASEDETEGNDVENELRTVEVHEESNASRPGSDLSVHSTGSFSDSCQPTPTREVILYWLAAHPGEPSRHLAFFPIFVGVVFLTSFLWTSTHWTTKILQVIFGSWCVVPVAPFLLFVPLTLPARSNSDMFVYSYILTPLFTLVMLISFILAFLVTMLTALSLSRRDYASVPHICVLVLCSFHILFVTLITVEPTARTVHYFRTVPFYPLCLCYCCCPKLFRCCHRCCCRRRCCRRCHRCCFGRRD